MKDAINGLSVTESYKNFQEFDMKKYEIKNKIISKSIYVKENVNKYFISLDMSSANFNCLKVTL
jgi:hypothetical protein